jgi:hypothetical protein
MHTRLRRVHDGHDDTMFTMEKNQRIIVAIVDGP